ncbi:DUF4291 domain-containing protein [Acidipropionibacterium acidipropionici]|jgi:hypothetical protein|uniref:DUF4291 domain-containing protein n=1 Tax=Acidipropionibacterium acidipropionici TaxID=1748 RepID=UPI0009ED32E8|nr:DUF4291 domain-containing protein [Acidipropionibacterium acidipropionici]AZP36505.1 DUF4291 domain-containing protein [Acidipropionibacterium acidipropionici]QCV96298.1 DUF4291 domain-containing protein [Acidipropionibacterium acidipropionici]
MGPVLPVPDPPYRQVRALFDDETVTVYQAYSSSIAGPAVEAQTFVAPFKTDRMSWIKPSFLWMMYRSGWATKPGQEHVLAIRITRTGFEAALSMAVLSHYEPGLYADRREWQERKSASPVRIQWNPERDPALNLNRTGFDGDSEVTERTFLSCQHHVSIPRS